VSNRRLIAFVSFIIVAFCYCYSQSLLKKQERKLYLSISERNNIWSHFDSKSVKSRLYEIERSSLPMLAIHKELDQEILQTLAENLDREIKRYNREKKDLQSHAIKHDNLWRLLSKKVRLIELGSLFYQLTLWLFAGLGVLRLLERWLLLLIPLVSFLIGSLYLICALLGLYSLPIL